MFKKISRLITIVMIVALALSMLAVASATPPRTVSLHLSGDAYGAASSLTLVSGGVTYTFTRPGNGTVWKNDNETLGVGSTGFTATVTVNGHTYTGVSFTVNGGGNGQDSGSTASDEFWAEINAAPTTKQLSYTVEYYKDGTHVTGDDILVTKTVDIAATTLLLDEVNYAPSDKYTGFHFSSISPDITGVTSVAGGTVIKVYYVSDEGPNETQTFTLTVNWVSDVGTVLELHSTSQIDAGNPYSTTQRTFPGYVFSHVTGDPVSGTMDSDKTVTYVYTENTPLIITIPEPVPPLVDNPPAEIPEETPPLVDAPPAEIPEETPPLSDSPQTGDLDNVAALGALLLASAFGIAVLTFGKKKEEQ